MEATTEELNALMDVLDAQFNILNTEGFTSSLYMFRYEEYEGEQEPCGECGGDGVMPLFSLAGRYYRDVDCLTCDGLGYLDKEKLVPIDESEFTSNILI